MSLYINQQKFLEENPEARTVTRCICGELHYVGDSCAEQPFDCLKSNLGTIAEQPFDCLKSNLGTIDKESKIRNLRKKRREKRLSKKDQPHLH
jgi:hypothetical protein